MVAFDGVDRLTEKVSSGSQAVSPLTLTVIVFDVSPGLNVTEPPTAVKSLGAVAVPLALAKLTVTGSVLAGVSVAVKTNGVVPLFPSFAGGGALIDTTGTSSLTMVAVAVPPAMVAFADGVDRFTLNVSFASGTVSPFTLTVTLFEVSPGLNVTVL